MEVEFEVEEKSVGYNPELSYGSHIFQDLVEAEILYTAVFSNEKTLRFAPEKLADFPDIIDFYTDDPDLKGVAHVYDTSKASQNCATTCKMKNWCCTGNKTFNQIKQAQKRT